MEVPIKMTEELVQSTDYKKKKGKLYFINSDGHLCEGVMCGIIARDTKGNPIYASPEIILRLGIRKEKGYLYFIKEGKHKTCEIWRKKMTNNQ